MEDTGAVLPHIESRVIVPNYEPCVDRWAKHADGTAVFRLNAKETTLTKEELLEENNKLRWKLRIQHEELQKENKELRWDLGHQREKWEIVCTENSKLCKQIETLKNLPKSRETTDPQATSEKTE